MHLKLHLLTLQQGKLSLYLLCQAFLDFLRMVACVKARDYDRVPFSVFVDKYLVPILVFGVVFIVFPCIAVLRVDDNLQVLKHNMEYE